MLARRASSSVLVADAAIVGSGVIGNAIALELSREAKLNVLVVDALPAAGSGSTSFSSGILRTMYSVPDAARFASEGASYFEGWRDYLEIPSFDADEEPTATLSRCGGLILRNPASADFLDKVLAAHEQVPGLEYEELTANEIAARFPDMDAASCFSPLSRVDETTFGEISNSARGNGGAYFPRTAYVADPQLAARDLANAARRTGRTAFAYGARVVSVDRRRGADGALRVGGVSLADGRRVEAPIVVNAAGPFSSAITRMAFPSSSEEIANDMRLTTRAMRQEVAYVPWRDAPGRLPLCSDLDAGIYFRPHGSDALLVGSTEPACDRPYLDVAIADPDEVQRPDGALAGLTDQWTNQVYRAALRLPNMPIPRAGESRGVAACYDVTEDWMPIYDKSSLPGYYMAIGTSGNQFKCAGVAGRLMREIVVRNETTGEDTDRSEWTFDLERTNGSIDPRAMFGRCRKVLETSGSVLG